MAAINTISIPLGFKAPDFTLLDTVSGEKKSLNDLKGDKATVMMFICNHCPYVLHINDELVKVANAYIEKGIGFIAISSNDVIRYPQDAPERMQQQAAILNYPFPYLYDESQEVAKAYKAACTPDFSIFDNHLNCVYRGQFDGSNHKNDLPVTGIELRNALDAILENKAIPAPQKPSLGCSIKWKEN